MDFGLTSRIEMWECVRPVCSASECTICAELCASGTTRCGPVKPQHDSKGRLVFEACMCSFDKTVVAVHDTCVATLVHAVLQQEPTALCWRTSKCYSCKTIPLRGTIEREIALVLEKAKLRDGTSDDEAHLLAEGLDTLATWAVRLLGPTVCAMRIRSAATKISENIFGLQHPRTVESHVHLSTLLTQLGCIDQALEQTVFVQRLIASMTASSPLARLTIAERVATLRFAVAHDRNSQQLALDALRQLYAKLRACPEALIETAMNLYECARCYYELALIEESIESLLEALETIEQAVDPSCRKTVVILEVCGRPHSFASIVVQFNIFIATLHHQRSECVVTFALSAVGNR